MAYGNVLTERPAAVHRTFRRLCGFELRGEAHVASPELLFRPSALMLWDLPPRATIAYALTRQKEQIRASAAAVPACFFATGHSFAEVVRRFEQEGIDAPFWTDFDVMDPGDELRLSLRGGDGSPAPLARALLLGWACLS